MSGEARYTVRQLTTIEIDYGAFEDLVKERYGVASYSFVASQECGNDTQHVWDIKAGRDELDKFDRRELAEFTAQDHEDYSLCPPAAYLLLQVLLRQGAFVIDRKDRPVEVLTEGQFIIRVSW